MKTTKTYSIEESIYNAFDSLTTEKNINKSSFLEDSIKKFLKDNDMDYIDKLYSLKGNSDHIVTVISKDSTFYFLDDGSKIPVILFMQIFKECDFINPKKFFNASSVSEKMTEKIKEIFSDIDNPIKKTIEKKVDNTPITKIKLIDIETLNVINNDYKSGKYITMDQKELCHIIIDLMKLNFNYGDKEYTLQQSLLNNLNNYKFEF